MLRVFPVLEDLEQVVVAPDAAILRRTRAGAGVAERRRGGSRAGGQDFLDRDLVLPRIAEVVFVTEGVLLAPSNLLESEIALPSLLLHRAHRGQRFDETVVGPGPDNLLFTGDLKGVGPFSFLAT